MKLVIPVLLFFFTYPVPDKRDGNAGIPSMQEESAGPGSGIDSLYSRLCDAGIPEKALKISLLMNRKLLDEGRIKNNSIITIVDYTKPSGVNRFFVIDVNSGRLLYQTLVAHGKNSGEELATSFSNSLKSYKSSLGFYITGKSYIGRHGYSLFLDGIEKGINDKARERAVVIHGAHYVSPEYIASHGRLGRSFGCPALPVDMAQKIIDTIKENSLLFIYRPDEDYCRNSEFFSSFSSSL
jgi:hypothetical protein